MQLLSAPWAAVETNIIPRVKVVNLAEREDRYSTAVRDLCNEWPGARVDIKELLMSDPHLSRVNYRVAHIPVLIEAMDEFVAFRGNAPDQFKALDRFAKSTLVKCTKQKGTPPDHPFFDCAERVKQEKDVLQTPILGFLPLPIGFS